MQNHLFRERDLKTYKTINSVSSSPNIAPVNDICISVLENESAPHSSCWPLDIHWQQGTSILVHALTPPINHQNLPAMIHSGCTGMRQLQSCSLTLILPPNTTKFDKTQKPDKHWIFTRKEKLNIHVTSSTPSHDLHSSKQSA